MAPHPRYALQQSGETTAPTGKGFRSWGETQIGRMLDRHRIPYLYEHPLAVVDDRGHTRIWYPDFQLQGYGMLLEYFGRSQDPQYQEDMVRKQAIYEANGLTALLLTPYDLKGNWPTRILDRIETTLGERMETLGRVRAEAPNERRYHAGQLRLRH